MKDMLDYNDFLEDLLAGYGLSHGYDVVSSPGRLGKLFGVFSGQGPNQPIFTGHRVFVQGSERKASLFRNLHDGNIYDVDTVADFIAEPECNLHPDLNAGGPLLIPRARSYSYIVNEIATRINQYVREKGENDLLMKERKHDLTLLSREIA